ncbi:hypothetical protein [Pollutibacter soli]|uniref:hypothetical protein n=1 Tax=Pollutibacter soli TaxID=3034157 RepID=UPI003013C359
MLRKKPDVDVILDVLNEFLAIYPDSPFVKSLLSQYRERGSLSKRQLEGLFLKAVDIQKITPSKLATLEAVIKKKAFKSKAAPPPPKPLYEKDTATGDKIDAILAKYPEHKRVKFFQAQYQNNVQLSPLEQTELERFFKLLVK